MDRDLNSPFDDWSNNIHAVITFLQPFFDDWRSYASLVSALLGVGVLIMENQVLLRMRMGRWEILGYILWCIISSVLGPIFDIIVMLGLLVYCRQRSNRMHITNESIAKALLPPPVAGNYRVMGAVCITATVLTLCSNILYMLRGWEEPLPFYDWSSKGIRWMTSQIWYAIGMIFLFHVVTRPAQSGVVLFGKFPRDLWNYKWYLCALYIPIHFTLLKLCDMYKDSKHILIPVEIVVDIVLYNGPFLIVLQRLLYLAWKVAYDEAVLTGAILEDDSGFVDTPTLSVGSFLWTSSSEDSHPRRNNNTTRPGTSGYVGLSLTDLDEAELGQSRVVGRGGSGRNSQSMATTSGVSSRSSKKSSSVGGAAPAYEARDSSSQHQQQKMLSPKSASPRATPRASPRSSPRTSPKTSPKNSSPLRNVIFSMESTDDEDSDDDYVKHKERQEELRLA
ncbi:hypothetical protein BGX29_010747 [Mortierella sp. GBA35]|nr:hypothetical protein BGX29_010747 [Mortierella sp. GBA35]